MLRRYFIMLFTALSLLLPVVAMVESTPSNNEIRDAKNFFDDGFDDYQQELETAKEEGKKGILFMFEMDNCPFCSRMKATVLNQGKVQDYYRKHFRVLSVDINGDLEITDFKGKTTTQKDLAFKSRVRATPVFQFYDLKGEPLKNGRFTGAAKNEDEFLLLGQFIVDKAYQKQSFSRYKRAQKAAKD